jgi:hypothetical protein
MIPYLIFSWEHNAFWKPNCQGYTRFIERAGRYSKADAERICKGASYGERRMFAEQPDEDTPPNEICFPAPEAFDDAIILASLLDEALERRKKQA